MCGSGKAAQRCTQEAQDAIPATAIRFGYMRYIGEFTYPPEMKFRCEGKIIVQTRRGIELGAQVSLTCTGCERSVPPQRIQEWVERCGQDSYIFSAGRILREATAADLAEYARIQASCPEKRAFCQQMADRHDLPIRVVECECPFGGERIIFYFTAAERVDFRAVVRELAREYRTRIEMRQIGARDEARLMADYETCGREVCCKSFLKTLKPISMRMAKLQKATLDPSQVSGRCGRLKCCLRYEHASYEELNKLLPRTGVRIRAAQIEGVVVNRQVLTQLVQIRTDADAIQTVAVEDIVAVDVPPPVVSEDRGKEEPAEAPPRERRPRRPVKGRGTKPLARGEGPKVPEPSRVDEPEPRTEPAPAETGSAETTTPAEPAKGAETGEKPQRPRRRGRRRPRRRRSGGESGNGKTSPPAGE